MAEHQSKEFTGDEIEFISFDHLRIEMNGFFREKDIDLPGEWLFDHKKWNSFRKIFANIIKDCSLKIKSNFKPILIEEFKLTKCEEEISGDKVRLRTDWEYKLVDNQTIFHSSMSEG